MRFECFRCVDDNLVWLVMNMEAKLDTLLYQQQAILKELTNTRVNNTSQLPAGVILPLQTFDQVQSLERKIQASVSNRQGMVCG